jgi:hypothetical protein
MQCEAFVIRPTMLVNSRYAGESLRCEDKSSILYQLHKGIFGLQ